MGLQEVEITTEPAAEPLTVAQFHTWANIPTVFTDDDAVIIPNVIKSARQMVERFLNRALQTQTITAWYSSFGERVDLPFTPIISVTTVKTKRLNVSTTLVENTGYYVQGNKDRYLVMNNPEDIAVGVSPADNLRGLELEVVYQAGYGVASTTIPQDIIDSVAMVALGNYKARSGGDKVLQGGAARKFNIINQEVEQKLNPYRVYTI